MAAKVGLSVGRVRFVVYVVRKESLFAMSVNSRPPLSPAHCHCQTCALVKTIARKTVITSGQNSTRKSDRTMMARTKPDKLRCALEKPLLRKTLALKKQDRKPLRNTTGRKT